VNRFAGVTEGSSEERMLEDYLERTEVPDLNEFRGRKLAAIQLSKSSVDQRRRIAEQIPRLIEIRDECNRALGELSPEMSRAMLPSKEEREEILRIHRQHCHPSTPNTIH
jgi:hypothetical protein